MLIKLINKLVNNIKSKRDKIIIPKRDKIIIPKTDKIIIPKAIIKRDKNKNTIQLIRLLAVEILGLILAMLLYG